MSKLLASIFPPGETGQRGNIFNMTSDEIVHIGNGLTNDGFFTLSEKVPHAMCDEMVLGLDDLQFVNKISKEELNGHTRYEPRQSGLGGPGERHQRALGGSVKCGTL